MARIVDAGIGYVPLDTDIFQDRKIRKLQRKCGPYSPMVYMALLCSIYREGYYVKWDEDFAFDLADSIHVEESFVNEVILGCLETGLLSSDMFERHRVLTSSGIQKQYQAICEKSKRKSRVREYSLLRTGEDERINSEEMPINSTSDGINSELMAINSEEMPDVKEEKAINPELMRQSKVKESKEKESYYSSSEEEQEKIVSYFFFEKNYPHPNEEYHKLVNYNNGPQARKKWADLTGIEKDSVMRQWRRKGGDGDKPRFDHAILEMWHSVYNTLLELSAPVSVRLAALSDGLRFKETQSGTLIIHCRKELYEFLEVPDSDKPPRIEAFKPAIWSYMRSRSLMKLLYLDEDGKDL